MTISVFQLLDATDLSLDGMSTGEFDSTIVKIPWH